MEKATNIVKHETIKYGILNCAPNGQKLSTRNCGCSQTTLTEWKSLIKDVRKAIIDYADSIQKTHNVYCKDVSDATTAFYDALDNVRKFAGMSFPNGLEHQSEIIVWFGYLTRAVKERDANGKIVAMPLAIASPETVRGHIETLLYLRETEQIGMTVKQYEEEKEKRKAQKKKARADEQKRVQREKAEAEVKEKAKTEVKEKAKTEAESYARILERLTADTSDIGEQYMLKYADTKTSDEERIVLDNYMQAVA